MIVLRYEVIEAKVSLCFDEMVAILRKVYGGCMVPADVSRHKRG